MHDQRRESMTEVTLRTQAWMGDGEKVFAFPDEWEVRVYPPRDGAAVDLAAIQRALANPIGTERLSDMARGKGSATIIVDDLSRPTPAARIAPFVLAELREAGVPEEGIRFVVGGGAHRPLTELEIVKKVGEGVVDRYEVLEHDAFSGSLVGLGNLEDGTPIYVHPAVAEAGVVIALGGIAPHPSAGLGGGGKLILPGVVGIATIAYSHLLFPGRPRGLVEGSGEGDDVRSHAEKVARHVGLDIIVNCVFNSQREVAGLFVGDAVEAHRAGCRFAETVYGTPIPRQAVEEADIVVINAYPQDYDPVQVAKAAWPIGLFENAYKVMLNPASDGILYHGLADRMAYSRWRALRAEAPPAELTPSAEVRSKEQVIVVSEHFPAADFYGRYPEGALFASWEAAVAELRRACPTGKVAALPCAPIQLPEAG
jgi:nickel-dependent lactate racemase